MGHTPHPAPDSLGVVRYMPNPIRPRSINYDVDFANRWITIIEDGVARFEPSPLYTGD